MRGDRGQAGLAAVGVFVAVLVIIAAGFVGVDPGREKVFVNKGQLADVKDPGWYWANPATVDTYVVSVRPQVYVQSGTASEGETQGDDSIESKTIDGNVVFVDVAVRYRVTDSRQFYLDWFHSDYGSEPFEKFNREKLRSPSRDLVRDIVGTINSETVYTGGAQQEIELMLEDELKTELQGSGVTLIDIDVRNIRFSADYQDTLEQKANSVQQREIQTNLAEADAEAKIIRAEADAEAAIIRAEGRKQADQIRAEGLSREVITIRQIEAYNNAGAIYVPVGSDGLPIYADVTASGNTTSDDPFGG